MKRLSLATLAVLFAAACGSSNNNPPKAPTIEVFTAAPSSIALGDSTQLIFAAESGATLSIDQGVGDVTGKTSVAVSPTATTSYTLTATKTAKSSTSTATVTVVAKKSLAVTFAAPDAWVGTAVSATVRAQDSFGHPLTNYAGTIAFTSSDAAAVTPANATLNGTEGGTVTVSVTFNTMGTQTLTATDTAAPASTGTGSANVHGLVYTDPAAGGKVRLIKNAASSAGVVQMDLVSNATLFAVTADGTVATVRNGVFGAGMNLPLDATKVTAGSPLIGITPPAGSSAVLNLGTTGTPRAIGAALSATKALLYSGISQKRTGTPATGTAPVVLGDASLRPFPGAASFYYSLTVRLAPGAAVGTVFDGASLGSKFHAAVRDRSGTDVFQSADFAIGKLEVR